MIVYSHSPFYLVDSCRLTDNKKIRVNELIEVLEINPSTVNRQPSTFFSPKC